MGIGSSQIKLVLVLMLLRNMGMCRWRRGVAIIAVSVAAWCGCSRKVYVPLHDSAKGSYVETAAQNIADTVIVVYNCSVKVKGDTVREVVDRRVLQRSVIRDTVRIAQCDTVVREIPVAVEPKLKSGGKWWIYVLCGAVAALLLVIPGQCKKSSC